MNKILILFFLFSASSFAAEPSEIPAGSSIIYPHLKSSRWVNYTITNCVAAGNPHSNCRASYDAVLEGDVELKIQLVNGVSNKALNNVINKLNIIGLDSKHGDFAWKGSGYSMNALRQETIPGKYCTPEDDGGMQRCLSRYIGDEYTVNVHFGPVVNALSVWEYLSGFALCSDRVTIISGWGYVSDADTIGYENSCFKGGPNDLTPPELGQSSVCSLNGQNLNLNYSSTSLNVTGLTQNTSLSVSCTTGDAQNYDLKLVGSNVVNGRLNFGNGVSAQVFLNGTPIQANGESISLNGLTSLSIPLSATLFGTAESSGVTNANGVLVLNAL